MTLEEAIRIFEDQSIFNCDDIKNVSEHDDRFVIYAERNDWGETYSVYKETGKLEQHHFIRPRKLIAC